MPRKLKGHRDAILEAGLVSISSQTFLRHSGWCAYEAAAGMPRKLKGHRDVILEAGVVSISSHYAFSPHSTTPAFSIITSQPAFQDRFKHQLNEEIQHKKKCPQAGTKPELQQGGC